MSSRGSAGLGVLAAMLALGLASCTAGRVVNDATNAPVPYAFVMFVNADNGQRFAIRTDASGQFGFDPDLPASGVNTSNRMIPEGNYNIFTGTDFEWCGPQTLDNVRWDHMTAAPFHHTYDTTCQGGGGHQERCEFYQVRISGQTLFPENPPPPIDSHTGTRIVTVYWQFLPAPLPCD